MKPCTLIWKQQFTDINKAEAERKKLQRLMKAMGYKMLVEIQPIA